MSNQGLYRDPVQGRITGVCAGLANYFGVEAWVVRLVVLSLAILGGFYLVFFAYIALSLMLEKRIPSADDIPYNQRGPGLKQHAWQQGESPAQRLAHLQRDFAEMESEIRKMEAYVTSRAHEVNRKFKDL